MLSAVAPRVRPAAQAGRFYPAIPARLQADVSAYLEAAMPPEGPVPKALIVPHAGYMFSAAVAASGFVQLAPAHDRIRRVVLIGPSHYEDFPGLAATSDEAFATPLGLVPVDFEAVTAAQALPQVVCLERVHGPEHCLEVELPFVQTVVDAFTVVPLLVGRASAEEVSEVLDRLWGGAETAVIVSSDLSHYLDYPTARRKDRATADAIQALRWQELDGDCACGHRAICGLLVCAQRRGLRCQVLDLRNSGDTAGPRDRVVGYGAFLFAEPA